MSEAAAEMGAFLRRERERRMLRGKQLSTTQFARMLNAYIRTQRLPVKEILQQEISHLENATVERGPKRRQPWWDVIVDFIEGGALDTLIAAAEGPPDDDDAHVVTIELGGIKKRRTLVKTPDGEVVGRIVWGEPNDKS